MSSLFLPVLPAQRGGHAAPTALQLRREQLAAAVSAGRYRTPLQPVEAVLDGVRALRFSGERDTDTTIIHFHGGGFRQGCPEMVGPFAAALVTRCRVEVVCPEYRLAPEFPYPAALHDGIRVIQALEGRGRNLIVSGDSAGGGLAASLALLCVASGIRLQALVLLSPWLDLTLVDECYQANAKTDALFSFESASEAAALYLQGASAKDALVSPVLARLHGLPPTFISVGTGEVLAGDAQRFHQLLQAEGVVSQLQMLPGMEHTTVVRDLQSTGAAESFEAIAQFIDAMQAQ